ncbi:hypothetical protein [Actinophytocola algeriensis]|uniref:Cytochrome c domain-containing protein n=1 Tax=Actinophytocola algeriensis TaxID=1768010 RepID=A0A7W7QDC3_9PSEU|nr:hypothetical protein [Actinophytocola algeriensis]MBB4911527.1 hypothetical protein [Actinophytocola algeriensis]MBE1473485.1 hypothetical protein [Actinophytocola algeriensis]
MKKVLRLLPVILSAVFLIGVHQVPASAVETVRTGHSAAVQTPCHACNGYRYQPAGSKAIYVVIDGLRHHVPSPDVYFRLWAGYGGLRVGGTNIPVGEPLVENAYLAQEYDTYRTYLVGRTKRWIPNPTVFNQYAFDWAKVQPRHWYDLPEVGHNLPGR